MNHSRHHELFREWLARYQGILAKVARSFAEPGDRDDLVQEMLLSLWNAVPAFRAESSPVTFVYRVACNCALTWQRSTRRRRSRFSFLEYDPPAPEAKDTSPVESLYEAIRELPEADRALVLLYLDDVSYKDMAQILGLTETNIGVRLTRIRQRLAATLKGEMK